ncbi:MAG TPA: DUF2971 domain-containing protein [Acidobacteriaceae bacterium]|nr:DUF2971 domain-containing protein [Acidobacteriaceae bacterium]
MRTIIEFLLQRPSAELFHYTDAEGLIGILGGREIWATSIRHLNDSREFVHAMYLLQEEARRRAKDESCAAKTIWNDLLDQWERKRPEAEEVEVGIASFSTEGNQLSQWRAYAPRGNGYSLGFSLDNLRYARRKSGKLFLVKCVYEEREKQELICAVADYFEKSWQQIEKVKGLGGLVHLFRMMQRAYGVMAAIKDEGFKEENEWRLVVTTSKEGWKFRKGRFGLLPYCPIPLCASSAKPSLSSVFIGPHPEPMIAEHSVELFLKDHITNAPNPNEFFSKKTIVQTSRIPYRY